MNQGMDESYMHHNHHRNSNINNDNNSSGASSDFFSPISLGFFGNNNRDVLPRSHDTSWIGARQSPIPSFDREDEEEDDDVAADEEANRATEKYHKALHESLEAAAFVNERTSLLHHRRTTQARQAAPIHPLWDGATPEERRIREINNHCRILWGDVLVVLTGIHLFVCSAWEVYLWHSSSDSGSSLTLTWMSILQPRSAQTLLLAGALDAETVLVNEEYWRLISSLVVCPSLLNWLLVCLGWTLLYSARRKDTLLSWYSWFGTWFASSLVGLVWMMAWDLRIRPVVGCALWGTGGVLTAAGMHRPEARWCHFLACILAVVLSWWEQPYNSVYGILGATFFGWGLGAATRQSLATKGPSGLSYASIGIVLSIALTPVLSIAFWGTDVPFLS